MGHDNLERRIKKKLEERRITPSAKAWDRLEKGLDEAPHAHRKKNIRPYWIAASAVVLLVVGAWFFKGERRAGDSPKVAGIQTDTGQKERKKVVKVVEEDTGAPVKVNIPVVKPQENTTPLVKSPETGRAVSFPETREKESVVAHHKEEALAFEDKKVEEVVSKIMEIEEKGEVTDEEIELLLAEAQKEIDSQRLLINQTGTVDAMALLEEVESELDKSFRDKVFEALKEGLKRVRTAVANRKE
ncbi:hypothetical protein [Sinomicrobium weinanense]|uniref:Anti-sigma factor n=1 Tax=Sinomicrobium weinanense TaxID=2842200 RepID=A0A926JVC5_9FLAO|nr:hypothetical protein [Sinomicrobium weinanense]MBC9798049.1 hypothetical protein [Sinomicrobium weinanense]MBU3124861.1 hypothetical protein [Sinomicrobium weinanense]